MATALNNSLTIDAGLQVVSLSERTLTSSGCLAVEAGAIQVLLHHSDRIWDFPVLPKSA